MLYSAVYLDGGEVSLSILPSVDVFASYNREIMFPHCQNPIRFHSNKSQGRLLLPEGNPLPKSGGRPPNLGVIL